MSRLAHAGCHAGDLRVTPFNGRLFAPSRTPLAERRDLDDEAARRALLALSTRRRPTARAASASRIATSASNSSAACTKRCSTTSRVSVDARRAGVSLRARLRRRAKATGTFYTPQPIAHYLVRRTLEPLVTGATPDEILRCASSIRRWAAARSSWRRAASSRRPTKRRSFATALSPERPRRARARGHSPDDRRALPLRRGSESDGRAARAAVALAGDARGRQAAQLSRSSPAVRQQPARRVARALRRAAGPHAGGRATTSLPLFDDDALASRPARGAAGALLAWASPSDTVEQVRAKERALAR